MVVPENAVIVLLLILKSRQRVETVFLAFYKFDQLIE